MKNKNDAISNILKENERRRSVLFAPFNPITGEHSIGERRAYTIPDFPIPTQMLPVEMMHEPLVKALAKAGSVDALVSDILLLPVTDDARAKVIEAEAEVPKAMAEAFRNGNLGIMDYYRMKNIEADTSMRETIARPSAGQAKPNK